MPIYEYRCDSCSEEFEQLMLKEGEAVCCPKCQSRKASRLLSCFTAKGADPFKINTSQSSSANGCGSGGFS